MLPAGLPLSRAVETDDNVDVLRVLVLESIRNRTPADAGLWVTDRVFDAANNGRDVLISVLLFRRRVAGGG